MEQLEVPARFSRKNNRRIKIVHYNTISEATKLNAIVNFCDMSRARYVMSNPRAGHAQLNAKQWNVEAMHETHRASLG
jgi:hypothetical protein